MDIEKTGVRFKPAIPIWAIQGESFRLNIYTSKVTYRFRQFKSVKSSTSRDEIRQ